jgi:hypothetical protein
MKTIVRTITIAAVIVVGTAGLWAIDSVNDPDSPIEVRARAELGVVKVLSHTLQFGTGTTNFDYVNQGGQHILFPFQRFVAELTIVDRHSVWLLYQPLTIRTQTRVPVDLAGGITIEDTTFGPGTGLDLKYGFDFWRVSYLYHVVKTERLELGVGLSLQLRNASIAFEALDGSGNTINQNLGPVPVLKLRAEYDFPGALFLGSVVDGFYATSAFLNGADFAFEGSILDASVYAGVEVNPATDLYLNARFLGGTAVGTSSYDRTLWTESTTSYSDNKLATMTVTLGARLK